MYQVTHKIKCDEPGCKECIECEDATDKADAFNIAEADGWHISGTTRDHNDNQITLWMCDIHYEGSWLEKDHQFENQCDIEHERYKDDQMVHWRE